VLDVCIKQGTEIVDRSPPGNLKKSCLEIPSRPTWTYRTRRSYWKCEVLVKTDVRPLQTEYRPCSEVFQNVLWWMECRL